MRGIITAIRNPLSHKDISYSKQEADAILLFISNYVLPKLDESKDYSFIDSWFDYIFINNKNYSNDYFDIVLSKISKKERFSLMIEIVNRICEIETNKYEYIINKLYCSLSKQIEKK